MQNGTVGVRFVNSVYMVQHADIKRVARKLKVPLEVLWYCLLPHMHSADWDIMQFAFGGEIRHPNTLAVRAVELDKIGLVMLAQYYHIPCADLCDLALRFGSINTFQLLRKATTSVGSVKQPVKQECMCSHVTRVWMYLMFVVGMVVGYIFGIFV